MVVGAMVNGICAFEVHLSLLLLHPFQPAITGLFGKAEGIFVL